MFLTQFILVLVAYLLGSVSSAVVVCRILGHPDPRLQGSGNPGATNVLRIAGRQAAVITLLGDVLKGLLPVLAAKALFEAEWVWAAAALAAFAGHLFPVFFQFRGGKGVATAFGALMALSYVVGAAVLITWLVVALLSRISSLAALVSAVLAPFYLIWLTPHWRTQWILWATVVIVVLLVWRHSANIHNLIQGKEKKIGKR